MSKPTRAQLELEARRREAEERLAVVRTSIQRETGWVPSGLTWVLPLVAFAGGLALSGFLRRR